MNSYLLHGNSVAKKEPNIICPTITFNCCTKIDQQRIYHKVNEVLLQRTLYYSERIKMALSMLKDYYEKAMAKHPKYRGSYKRKFFCKVNREKLSSFKFDDLYKELQNLYDNMRLAMDENYKTFYCSLCDGLNHSFFNEEENTLMVDFEFCRDQLRNNKEIAIIWNVKLLEVMELLQHEVDCNHYKVNYNLPFFNKKYEVMKEQFEKCIYTLETEQFEDNC